MRYARGKAGSRFAGIIPAAVVLLVLVGLLVYLAWKERKPKPKSILHAV